VGPVAAEVAALRPERMAAKSCAAAAIVSGTAITCDIKTPKFS
jgi:hypothetical protein